MQLQRPKLQDRRHQVDGAKHVCGRLARKVIFAVHCRPRNGHARNRQRHFKVDFPQFDPTSRGTAERRPPEGAEAERMATRSGALITTVHHAATTSAWGKITKITTPEQPTSSTSIPSACPVQRRAQKTRRKVFREDSRSWLLRSLLRRIPSVKYPMRRIEARVESCLESYTIAQRADPRRPRLGCLARLRGTALMVLSECHFLSGGLNNGGTPGTEQRGKPRVMLRRPAHVNARGGPSFQYGASSPGDRSSPEESVRADCPDIVIKDGAFIARRRVIT